MVLYAVLTEQFVIDLFVAAMGPAVLAVLLYLATIAIVATLQPDKAPSTPRASWAARWRATWQAWRAMATVGLVIAGIYSGVFTVLEAAAVGVFITAVFWIAAPHRSLTELRAVFLDTAALTGMVIVMVIGASAMGYLLALTDAPARIVAAVVDLGLSPMLVMICIIAMYIALGTMFDSISAMVITLPFVFPLVTSLGFDPVWWGIMNVMIIEIALITPPVGMNIFILNALAPHIRVGEIFRAVVPFILADLVWLAVMLAFPAIALWLPGVLAVR